MEKIKAEEASELLKEIKELSKYKDILENKRYTHTAHFQFCQHYGENSDTVIFDHKYTDKFIVVVEEIIKGLEGKLANL